MKTDLPFVCVLKSGGIYGPSHVRALLQNLRRFNADAKLICLSDFPELGCDAEPRPLLHGLSGWFSKLEVFELPEKRFIYLDLDVVIAGPIRVNSSPGLHLLGGFGVAGVNSSVMLVDGDFAAILHAFLKDPEGYTSEYRSPEKWGDQDFIRDFGKLELPLQETNPGLAGSWKSTLRYKMGWIAHPPSILVFHGRPKPEEVYLKHREDGAIFIFSLKYFPKFLLRLIF